MTGHNIIRSAEELLDKHESDPPSFSVHLYPEHWTLNNGPKFLYNNPVASLLDDVRSHRIPVDYLELFDSAQVPFYEGCMLVELLDYRPKRAKDPPLDKPERSRVTLHPNDETLWADLCLMNKRAGSRLTDPQILEVEAKIVLHTSPPLCLDPDPHLTRIANHTLRVSAPSIPVSLKRKLAAITQEEDESEKARRAKIMQFMNPRLNRSHNASGYPILDIMAQVREKSRGEAQVLPTKAATNVPIVTNRSTPAPTSTALSTPTQLSQSAPTQTPVPAPASTPTPAPTTQPTANGSKPRQIKKEPGGSPYPNTPRATATPVPHPVVNQLQNQQPIRSPPVHARSPVPTNPPFQQHRAGTPMVAGSPAQRGYTQSPRPPSSQARHTHSSPLASGSQLPPTDPRAHPNGVQFIQVAPGAPQSKASPQLAYSKQASLPPQPATSQPQPHPQQQSQPVPSPQIHQAHPNAHAQPYYAHMQQQQQRMAQVPQVHPQAQVQAQTPAQVPAQTQIQAQVIQVTQHAAISAQYHYLRPMTGQGNPHPQVVPHLAQNQPQNMATSIQGQVMDGQQQMMAQYPMYAGYPVGYGMTTAGSQRLQAPYAAWAASGMGRVPNVQPPGMQPGHPQMQVTQGKAGR